MAFVPGTNYISVAVGGIDTALASATSGDVLVLAPGTHAPTIAVPAGVTMRGQYGQRAATIVQCSNYGLRPWATVRGVTLEQTGGTACLQTGGGGAGTRWVEDCIIDATDVLKTETEDWVFARCDITGHITMNGGDITVAGCLFDAAYYISGAGAGGAVTVYNTTFLGAATSGNAIVLTGFSSDKIYNNVFNVTGADTSLILVFSGGTIYGNWSTYNLGNASWGTVVADLRLRSDGYPTNESPVRIAATPQSGDAALDLRYLPFASARSAGCYQWSEDTTALYRRRVVDPLDGFALDYDLATLDMAPGRQTFGSHLELAAYVRTYVNDLVHPYYGAFYTSATGAYRLRTWFGDPFDLTISGESASVFGAASLSAVDDTG